MFSDIEIAIFQEELEEKLQIIYDSILLLEQRQVTPAVIQEIFRAAHTIKGSSAVMGYDRMTELTHNIESLFDEIRHDRLEVTGAIVDILFESMDTLTDLKDEIVGGNVKHIDIEPLIEKLKLTWAGKDQVAAAVYPAAESKTPKEDGPATVAEPAKLDIEIDSVVEDVISEAELQGFRSYGLKVIFEDDCQMKEVRAFLLFDTLEQAGEIIVTLPPAEDIQNGHFDQSIELIIISQSDPDQIKNLALSVAEIKDVFLKPIEIGAVSKEEAHLERHLAAKTGEPGLHIAGQSAVSERQQNGSAETAEKKTIKTVRVDVEKLDTLMNLVGELVIDRTRLDRFVDVFENEYGTGDLVDDISDISTHLGQVTTDLQHEIMKARMLPVAQVFNRFPRMVRDIAHKLGKDVEFIIEGKETELDRNVIEVIGDPLIHLLRNSIDHGIEEPAVRLKKGKPARGLLQLKASYVESHIVITVVDDGQGINVEKLKDKALRNGAITQEQYNRMSDREAMDLIFVSGFSTVDEDQVSDISGRGVGMDIVRTQIENINGTVEYSTTPGRGTSFAIKLPLTLAIIRALMVESGARAYAFPLTYVVETLNVNSKDIKNIRHTEVIVVRGQVYQLKRLGDIFLHDAGQPYDQKIYVVIVGSGQRKLGIVVDKLIGEQEIVIKSLGGYLGQVEGLSGAAILGDGNVSLIVDVRGLLRNTGAEEAVSYAASN